MVELEILSSLFKKEVIKIESDWDGIAIVYFSDGDFTHTKWKTLFLQVCKNINEIKNGG